MKNPVKFFGIAAIGAAVMLAVVLSLAGCATTVPIKSVKMPTINGMDTVKNLGIRDFENRGGGSVGSDLAYYLSDKSKQMIMATGKFTIVAPNDPNADGVFFGEIRSVAARDTQNQNSYKDKNGNTFTYTTYTREVSVEFVYGVNNTRTNMPFGLIPKRGSTSTSSDDPYRLTDVNTLARSIVDSQMRGLEKDLVPTIVTTNRELMKETSDDKAVKQLMKMALSLVKAGNLEEAIRQYDEIDDTYGSVAARTNAGILRESVVSETAVSAQMARLDGRRRGLIATAVTDVVDTLNSKLPSGTNIVVMKTSSTNNNMLNDIVDQITTSVVQAGNLKLVDRSNQALIDAEQQFQLSGNVSDDSAVLIGRQLGVKYAVLCWISGERSSRKLNIRMLDIETAQITDQTSFDI
jgi:hypothetical protein